MSKIERLAKELFQKIYKMNRLPYTSEIKATYPRFKASNKEHWEFLILKLLGYTATVRKPLDIAQENMQNFERILAEKLKVLPGKRSSFPNMVTNFHHKSKFIGTLGYSSIRNVWYCRIADEATKQSGFEVISEAFYKSAERIVIKSIAV